MPEICAECPAGHRFLGLEARGRVLRSGQVLFRRGEVADEVFCVSGALVKLVVASPGDRTTVVDVVGPGALVGLSSAFGPGIHPYTAEVIVEGSACTIAFAALRALLDAHPAWGARLAQQIALEAHRGIRRLALLSTPGLAPRLSALLLELAAGVQAAGALAAGVQVGQGLSRRDMAGLCGVGHEAVVRCLSRWKRQGLIESRGGPITLLDPGALASIAGELSWPQPLGSPRQARSAPGQT